MFKVEAALKRYNANSRDNRVGDCVKRSLSVAYSMDYDQVSSELNKIKKELHSSVFNSRPVYSEFIKRRGDQFTYVKYEAITVDEFCNEHSEGVWLILCGKDSPTASGHSSHMAAIVNGDVYDSWDSRQYYIFAYTPVSTGKTDVYDMDIDDIHIPLTEFMKEYVAELSKKCPPNMLPIRVLESYERDDRYTGNQYIRLTLKDVPEDKWHYIIPWGWKDGKGLGLELVLKMNPRLSVEENLEVLKKRCKQKIYDWVYPIRKTFADFEKLQKFQKHPNFYGNRKLLMQLPDECIPHIIWCRESLDSDIYDNYEAEMEALPEDPRAEYEPIVYFTADTLSELKHNIKWYMKDFARFNYDY